MSNLENEMMKEKIYEEVCSDNSTSMMLYKNAVMMAFRCDRDTAELYITEEKIKEWENQQ